LGGGGAKQTTYDDGKETVVVPADRMSKPGPAVIDKKI
jgi:hypothetical protein